MPLTPESDSSAIYISIKLHKLWRELKKPVEGCKEIEVTNPTTRQTMKKYGYHYNDVTGYVVALEKYKREAAGAKYAGFKMKMFDGADTFFVDMPLKSVFLRKFMKVMHNIDFRVPLKIAAWKSKEKTKKGNDETAIWWTQNGVTVPYYFTKDHPNGMPQARKDPHTDEWDFREQLIWLLNRIEEDIKPRIAAAADNVPKKDELTFSAGQHDRQEPDDQQDDGAPPNAWGEIDDSDCPF
jgi:hypothetical protein